MFIRVKRMGCGSLSTEAVRFSHGPSMPARARTIMRDKDAPNRITSDEKRNLLSVGYSPLVMSGQNPEKKNEIFRHSSMDVTGDHHKNSGGQVSNFTISFKDIDEKMYNHDDGGIWFGTEQGRNNETQRLETSHVAHGSRNKDLSSSGAIEPTGTDSPDVVVKDASAEYASINFDRRSSLCTAEHAEISTDKRTVHEPLPALFKNSSQKKRHFRNNHVQFESVEDTFSYNYGLYDDDKQMSDSELDDNMTRLISSRTSETVVKLNESGSSGSYRRENGNEDLATSDIADSSSQLPESHQEPVRNSPLGALSSETSKEKTANGVHERLNRKGSPTNDLSLADFAPCADNSYIPHFVFKCISYIEAEGLKTEGIYRLSGSKPLGEQFVTKYSAEPEVDIAALEIPVSVIAALLKSFFNDLSEALIPTSLYDELKEMAEMTNDNQRLALIRDVIKKLPTHNFEVLKYLITHLSKVAQHQEFNSMTSSNLAKCWWPTLMRLQFKNYETLIQGSKFPEDVVQLLIENCAAIFHDESEV